MNVMDKLANGIKSIVSIEKSMSQVQASWRFFNNDIIDIKIENEPIVITGVEEIEKRCKEYCLVAHDWSDIDYKRHQKEELWGKRERRTIKGYELQSSLALSDKTGEPISPLAQNLKTSINVYSTYKDNIDYSSTHLEELGERIRWINSLNIKKKIVNIVDREGDSVGFLRDIKDEQFLIRVRNQPTLHWVDEDKKINGKKLSQSLEHKEIKTVQEKNKIFTLEGCEVAVEVKRKQTIDRKVNGKRVQKRIDGVAIKARFLSVRLLNEENKVLSTWLLLSNVESSVSLETLATWYYYRWKIENYFKLLKSGGHHLESWQQETPKAIFRRLIVVSYACTLVWKLANSKDEKAEEIRELLIRLSGRQMKYGVDFTYPALFAGFWNFLVILDVLELYDYDTLLEMKSFLKELFGGII
jgi:hypothetical protein